MSYTTLRKTMIDTAHQENEKMKLRNVIKNGIGEGIVKLFKETEQRVSLLHPLNFTKSQGELQPRQYTIED